LYPENASKKLNILQPEALSTSASMLGNEYESLGHALFKSVKSTHILHFPFAFFTKTTLASHSGYLMAFHVFFLNQSNESDAEAMGE